MILSTDCFSIMHNALYKVRFNALYTLLATVKKGVVLIKTK